MFCSIYLIVQHFLLENFNRKIFFNPYIKKKLPEDTANTVKGHINRK